MSTDTTMPLPPSAEALQAVNKAVGDDASYRAPASVEDVTRVNVELIRQLDQAAVDKGSAAGRVAGLVACYCGRMQFVWLHVAWFGGWILVNTLRGLPHFDPYPFTFLTMVVSLEAIFLSTFVLMSQNHEMRISERRNQLDLQINLLTEQENTKMLQLLERIAAKVGVDEDDPTVKVLEEATRPDKLIEQIEKAYEATASPRQR
ncbi:MAG: hypothetical protein JWP29_2770 [Rhodoferax sp.]|nr:hypothetical protein [Rhodoferax sp.]